MEKKRFEDFYQKYYTQLYLYAFSLCHHEQEAQDLVSETFYRMISVEFTDEQAYRYWLFRIYKNLLIDDYRKMKHVQTKQRDLIPHPIPETITKLLQKEQYHFLYEKIIELNSPHKEIILLHYFLNYSLKDVSQMLTLTYGTVKVAAHRGATYFKEGVGK